jgi:phage tail-like protein
MSSADTQPLLSLLPAIYREDEFVGRYIAAFEQVLLGLERQIDDISKLFHPLTTQADFLPWLSSWVAFTLRADLQEPEQRAFLAKVVSLYRRRGTKQNLLDLLAIFTRAEPSEVVEGAADPGVDAPHFFRVTINLKRAPPAEQLHQFAISRALVDLEKPAHTDYELKFVFPSMKVGFFSTVGRDTLLGSRIGV